MGARAAGGHAGSAPPIAGPSTNPSPNAAPMTPIPFARSSDVVTSATNARAIAMFAVAAPAKRRDASNTTNVPARPYRRNAADVMKIETSSTGRRPSRSESRPHSGAKRNCIAE